MVHNHVPIMDIASFLLGKAFAQQIQYHLHYKHNYMRHPLLIIQHFLHPSYDSFHLSLIELFFKFINYESRLIRAFIISVLEGLHAPMGLCFLKIYQDFLPKFIPLLLIYYHEQLHQQQQILQNEQQHAEQWHPLKQKICYEELNLVIQHQDRQIHCFLQLQGERYALYLGLCYCFLFQQDLCLQSLPHTKRMNLFQQQHRLKQLHLVRQIMYPIIMVVFLSMLIFVDWEQFYLHLIPILLNYCLFHRAFSLFFEELDQKLFSSNYLALRK